MGRFCFLCQSIRPNEAFGSKGERARICRKCRRMPREKRNALMHQREIHGFMEQSHISQKNIARLRALASSSNARIASLAALVLEVAMLTPYRRPRISTLARQRRDMLTRMEEAGLILTLPAWEETDPDDVDPVAAWYEWVALTESYGGETYDPA
jgi:hypothetical protein